MQVKTKSGFKCDINPKIVEDWRLVRAISKASSDSTDVKLAAAVEIVSLIMGKYEEDFYKYLASKNEDGIVSEEAVTEDIQSIIEKINALKNS